MNNHIEKALTLSTAHITEETARWLDTNPEQFVIYQKKNYGWFISVRELEDFEGIPADLVFLIGYAMGCDCDWIQLDQDAGTINGLPTFDW